MEVRHILSFFTLASFACCFFASRCTRQSYLTFILYALPFIDLLVTKTEYGALTVFDVVTYIAFLFLARKVRVENTGAVSLILFCLLSLQLLLGCILSEFLMNSAVTIVKTVSVFIYAKLLADECTDNPAFAEKVIQGLKFNCAVSVVFLVVQLCVGLDFTFYAHVHSNTQDSYVERYPSFFQDPQMYAQFLAITGFLFLAEVGSSNWRGVAFFMLLLLCIFLTGGRAAMLGMCVGSLFMLFKGRKRNIAPVLAFCLLGGVAAMYCRDHFSMFNRMENLTDAYAVRHEIWTDAFSIFKRHPYLGIGIGNYQNFVDAHGMGSFYVVNGEILNCGTESGYLKILVETGITGSMLVALLVLLPAVRGARPVRNLDGSPAGNANACLLASVVSWLVAFTTLYSFMDMRIFVIVATVLTLLSVLNGEGHKASETSC